MLTENKWIWAAAYLITILLGNIAVDMFGVIKIGWLAFPAGVVFIGLTFSCRDFVQREWGDWACWYWMAAACLITTLFNWSLALASFAAFLISESVDWFSFKSLKMSFRRRIYISNAFSTPLDSMVFVWVAFGWLPEAMIGQAVIKYLSGLLVLPFIKGRK